MTTETPQMWDVINKMNDELAEVQDELTESKNENELLKKIVKGLMLKVITMDYTDDLIGGGLSLFKNERHKSNDEFKYTKDTNVDDIMKKICDEMNESNWNDDGDNPGRTLLLYDDKNLEVIFNDTDDSDDDSEDD